jgi:hypothetical protein
MKPSKEVLSNGKGYVRETGWSHRGFTLLIEPDNETGRFVVCGRERLESSNLISFFGETVDRVARENRWTVELLEENPALMEALLTKSGDNTIVPEGVTTEVHTDNRSAATVLHERLPILELAGVQIPVQVS